MVIRIRELPSSFFLEHYAVVHQRLFGQVCKAGTRLGTYKNIKTTYSSVPMDFYFEYRASQKLGTALVKQEFIF